MGILACRIKHLTSLVKEKFLVLVLVSRCQMARSLLPASGSGCALGTVPVLVGFCHGLISSVPLGMNLNHLCWNQRSSYSTLLGFFLWCVYSFTESVGVTAGTIYGVVCPQWLTPGNLRWCRSHWWQRIISPWIRSDMMRDVIWVEAESCFHDAQLDWMSSAAVATKAALNCVFLFPWC